MTQMTRMTRVTRMSAAVATVLGVVVSAVLARGRLLHWGATDPEVAAGLPGDDLIPGPDLSATRAVTIGAPRAEVWPWIAQMGQGRGGLYSYDRLENIVGCKMHSADRIVDEWQDVEVGDAFRLHPDVALQVASVDPGSALVVRGGVPMGEVAPPYDFTWAFTLTDSDGDRTRLVVRERYAYNRWWAPLLVEPVELVSFFMTSEMLRGIRRRAQQRHPTRDVRTAGSEA